MKIKKECTQEELNQFQANESIPLTEFLNEAVSFLPEKHRGINIVGESITLLDGSIEIRPCIHESKSIGGIYQQPGWEITTWRNTPATQFEEADCVPVDERTTRSTVGAAVIAVKLAFDVLMENWGDNKNTELYVKELQEEEVQ